MTEEMAMQYQRGYIDGFKEGKAIFEPKIGCKGCMYENAMIYQEKDRRITDQTLKDIEINTVHWIHTEECDEEWPYRCSKCNRPSKSNAHRYCSNCGSYMYSIKPQERSEE